MDTLCCARAICVTKAWLHKDDTGVTERHYHSVTEQETYQARMAIQLHEEAGVPIGPYGHEALEKFQAYLSQDYQLQVMSMTHPYMVRIKVFQHPSSYVTCNLKIITMDVGRIWGSWNGGIFAIV